jgi:hypothetical protein
MPDTVGMLPFFNSEQANLLGDPISTLTCTATSSQTGAALVISKCTILHAASGTANSAIMSATTQRGGPYFSPYMFSNHSASGASAVIYAPVSGYMNATLNGSITLAVGRSAMCFQIASGVWASIPGVP